MSQRLKLFIEGLASTLDLYPAEGPPSVITDPEARLRRAWERTGQAIQRATDRFASEQPVAR